MNIGRVAHDIEEIAVGAESRTQFRHAAMESICRSLGFDHAGLYSMPDSGLVTADVWNIDGEPICSRIGAYMSELSPTELRHVSAGRAVIDRELFAPRRRDALGVYREYVRRHGINSFIARMWTNRFGCFWVTLGRLGRSTFRASDAAAVDRVWPTLQVAEALHAAAPSDEETARRAWAMARGVTQKEYEVIRAVSRGLRNKEAACALKRSVNTVRIQLESAFKKLDVSTRTELATMLHERPDDLSGSTLREWKRGRAMLER